MKKLFGIILLFIIFIPFNVLAFTTDIQSIKDINVELKDNESNLEFKILNTSKINDNLELNGEISNGNIADVEFAYNFTFYDEKYNIVANATDIVLVKSGTVKEINHIISDNELRNGYTLNDIVFYKLMLNPNVIKDKDVDKYDYVINNYDIEIIVNENNTLEITENIKAYFNIDKHGIYRKIPIRNTIYRLDGTISRNRAKISDINVNEEFDVSGVMGYKTIKIGSPNKTYTGFKDYKISYVYDLGKDTGKDYDELYVNLIGTEWDTIIQNASFKIVMPKEFDKSKLGFSSGVEGSTDSSNVTYQVDGNVITGKINSKLMKEEGLTIRLELPEEYFVGESSNFGTVAIVAMVIPIVFALIAVALWRKYGKEDLVVETVEFYPPEGFNSMEIGFLYNGTADSRDVVSLLIYLANKGYIKITEYEEKVLFSAEKKFKITKLKEYDGNNKNEKTFLDGLFKDANDLNEVTSSDLENSFYKTMNKILLNINKKDNREKIFTKKSSGKGRHIRLMIFISYCVITIIPLVYDGLYQLIPFALLFPGIGFTVMFSGIFGFANKNNRYFIIKLFMFVWGLLFGGVPWMIMIFPLLMQDYVYLIIYLVGVIAIIIMAVCMKYMPKRTEYGNQMLGKLRGFKNFLETAEKAQLEAMVEKNPKYFYDILPYTYVLGVSDKWINKFESIAIQEPDWYSGTDSFSVSRFSSFMDNTMTSASNSMTSSPSSSSGGSFGGGSGGGSSGGGSGGGGGGSW